VTLLAVTCEVYYFRYVMEVPDFVVFLLLTMTLRHSPDLIVRSCSLFDLAPGGAA
jgi:hypothetical protein